MIIGVVEKIINYKCSDSLCMKGSNLKVQGILRIPQLLLDSGLFLVRGIANKITTLKRSPCPIYCYFLNSTSHAIVVKYFPMQSLHFPYLYSYLDSYQYKWENSGINKRKN